MNEVNHISLYEITARGQDKKAQVETRRNRSHTLSTMAFVVPFGLVLLILTSSAVEVDSYSKQYISVVSDVHEYYGTSSVFFVLSRNNRSLEDYTSIHSLSRDFSRKYDFSSIIYFDQLDQRTTWYRKRIGRSLLVISLRSMSDIAEFTKKSTIESYIWLVIFTNEFGGSEVCDYCNSPNGNDFQLRFDTEMLVLCCDSLILKEWWSINESHTEVSDFAFWTSENRTKLIFLASSALITRRPDLKGAGIRIGLVETSPCVHEVGDKIQGLFGDILTELKRSMNFTIAGTVRSPLYGSWNSTTKKGTGIVGRVATGVADLGVADFTISKERLQVLEFTIPLVALMNRLYIRDPRDRDEVYWIGYLQVFSSNIWLVLSVVLILAPTLLALIKLIKSSRSLPLVIGDSYLTVWGILCQQGLHEFPVRTSLRIAYFSVFVLALIIYAAYTASLASFITISFSKLPFTTLDGFVNDGSYRLIVVKGNSEYDFFQNSEVPVIKRMMEMMKPVEELPDSIAAGWDQVCQERVALYTIYLPDEAGCKITALDSGYKDNLAMIMTAGNQYRKVINYHLQRFKDTGVLDHMNKQYFNAEPMSTGPTFKAIDLLDVAPLLAILAIGIISAMILLSGEALYYALKTYLIPAIR